MSVGQLASQQNVAACMYNRGYGLWLSREHVHGNFISQEFHCNLFAGVDSGKIGSNHWCGHVPSKIPSVYSIDEMVPSAE